MPARRVALSLLGVTLLASPAAAEDAIPGHTVDTDTDGLITGSAVLTSLSLMAIPVREGGLWKSELFSADGGVRGNISRRAGAISDAALVLSVATPVVYLTGTTIDDADGDRLLLYAEAQALNLVLNTAAKYIVQRPRPYLYSKDPAAARRATAKGDDSRLSFYSGHAAASFCGAVSGAYLLSTTTESNGVRMTAWGVGLGVAAATANLRVRAGEHFYSDVVIGSIVGMAIGYAVPALHADKDERINPTGEQLAIGGVGILAGLLASQLIPLEKKYQEIDDGSTGILDRVQLAPIAIANGAGIGIAGTLR